MATERLILAKDLKCPKWSHSVSPIKKGTQVETELHGEVYTVKHPEFMSLYIHADKSYFVDNRKYNIKVGDKFWFASIYTFKIWQDEVVKTTLRFAHFKKHPSKTGAYKIEMYKLTFVPQLVNYDIKIEEQVEVQNWATVCVDNVFVSKNKNDIQKELLILIKKSKIDKEHAIDKIAKEHTQKMEEYEKLELQEKELLKQMNNL